MKSYMSASGVVWAAARVDARAVQAAAATKVHAAALSAILMFSSPPLEFTKSKMSLWQPRKCGWRGGFWGGGEKYPPPTTPMPSHALSLPPQRQFDIRQFERPHSFFFEVADNAAACAFGGATATFVSSKFWASER